MKLCWWAAHNTCICVSHFCFEHIMTEDKLFLCFHVKNNCSLLLYIKVLRHFLVKLCTLSCLTVVSHKVFILYLLCSLIKFSPWHHCNQNKAQLTPLYIHAGVNTKDNFLSVKLYWNRTKEWKGGPQNIKKNIPNINKITIYFSLLDPVLVKIHKESLKYSAFMFKTLPSGDKSNRKQTGIKCYNSSVLT